MAIKDADSDSNSNSVSAAELSRHNRESDLWIAVDGKVYDMTEFAPQHPGGSSSKSDFFSATFSSSQALLPWLFLVDLFFLFFLLKLTQ